MTDITQRLRHFCTDWDGSEMGDHTDPMPGLHCIELREAADTIESLTRERDEALAEAQALRADAELGEIVLAEVADFCKAADRVCIATVQRRLGIRWKHAERLVHAVVARGMVEGMPATELAQAGAAIDSARSA